MVGSAQEHPTIADGLMSELGEIPLDSGVNVVGVSYYENIDAIVIGLEKKTYTDNDHLRNSMIASIYEIMPVILTHPDELSGKKIVFTGSSISLNAKGSRTMMKIFHTEIGFDLAREIAWSDFDDEESREHLMDDCFEYVWWHSRVKEY
ncbi:hypothetical protein MCMEM_1105 [Methanococcoides methylutens MM1]|uniref:Uncharacterized protein n=2 Tax=Methanococcoides methylutens TaxID=2226 RepID=A0A0E3SRW7_METMT|nr:hypothetical protein MCMEM_1105 [Methanococcoides methylutens MM1]